MEFKEKKFTPTVEEKKAFAKWVLNNLQLPRREMTWILNYLISHDGLLEKVHFVEKGALRTPKGMVICELGKEDERYGSTFVFIDRGHTTGDCEKAFHYIRLNRDEDVWIEIVADNLFKNASYISAIEENIYYKEDNLKLKFTDALGLKTFLDHMEAIARKQQIDFLLEKRDFETLAKILADEVKECTEKE